MSFPGRFMTFLRDEIPLADHKLAKKNKIRSYIRSGGCNFLIENNTSQIRPKEKLGMYFFFIPV